MSRLDHWCLSRIARRFRGGRCRLRLWDGCSVSLSAAPLLGTVTIADRATLWRLMLRPELAFGEGYVNGSIEVAGDLTRIMSSVNAALSSARAPAAPVAGDRGPSPRRLAAARHRVQHHYDLSNDFYRLWLDRAMVYTCAYFEKPGIGLDEAQRAKLEYVCRKLNVRPGDRVIEAGCGWGALALHLARCYGVTVRAYNISEEQLRFARETAVREGLSHLVTFIDGDCRSISGECDVFVSVGMLEHLGAAQYDTLGAVIDRVLDPHHGRGLLHFIGRTHPKTFDAFVRRYIFPGAYAPVLSEVAGRLFEPHNLAILDVENLRPHYAATLRHWRARFERVADDVAQMFDDRFVRMWRLYLSGSEAAFVSGDLQLFQVTFGRAADDQSRWTRADLYRSADPAFEGSVAEHM